MTKQMKAWPAEFLVSMVLASVVALYSAFMFDGAEAIYRLWYYVPAALVAGSLVTDRCRNRNMKRIPGVIDGAVALVCISRPLYGWPPASGHAVFFVYALLTGSSVSTRVFAIGLGVITLYAKIRLWHWDQTLWPGLIIGLISGLLFRREQSQAGQFLNPDYAME